MRLGLLLLGLLMAAPGHAAEAAAAPASRAEMKEQLKGTRQQLRDTQGRIKKAKKDKRKAERQERNLVGELVKLNRVLDTELRSDQFATAPDMAFRDGIRFFIRKLVSNRRK